MHCGARSPIDQLRSPWTQLLPLRTKEVAIWPILPQGDRRRDKRKNRGKGNRFQRQAFYSLTACAVSNGSHVHPPLSTAAEREDGRGKAVPALLQCAKSW